MKIHYLKENFFDDSEDLSYEESIAIDSKNVMERELKRELDDICNYGKIGNIFKQFVYCKQTTTPPAKISCKKINIISSNEIELELSAYYVRCNSYGGGLQKTLTIDMEVFRKMQYSTEAIKDTLSSIFIKAISKYQNHVTLSRLKEKELLLSSIKRIRINKIHLYDNYLDINSIGTINVNVDLINYYHANGNAEADKNRNVLLGEIETMLDCFHEVFPIDDNIRVLYTIETGYNYAEVSDNVLNSIYNDYCKFMSNEKSSHLVFRHYSLSNINAISIISMIRRYMLENGKLVEVPYGTEYGKMVTYPIPIYVLQIVPSNKKKDSRFSAYEIFEMWKSNNRMYGKYLMQRDIDLEGYSLKFGDLLKSTSPANTYYTSPYYSVNQGWRHVPVNVGKYL